MRRLYFTRLLAPITALILLAVPLSAKADGRFVEFGGGLGRIKGASPFFRTPYSNLDRGFSGVLSLGSNITSVTSFFGFGFILANHFGTGTEPAGSFVTAASYPGVRLEMWKFGFTAGYTPFVWGTGSDHTLHRQAGATSLLLEAYMLFPITPEIDFALRGGQQRISFAGDGPTITDYGVFFRLNFGLTDGEKKSRRKFKGWRYPFGKELN